MIPIIRPGLPSAEPLEIIGFAIHPDALRMLKHKMMIREVLFQREMHPVGPTPDRPLTTHTGDPRDDPTGPPS